MSDAKHTPGPWKYGTRKDGTMWMSLGDYMTGQHFQFDWIAGEANARLIAAAPFLLAACKAALETHPDPCRFDHHGLCQEHNLRRNERGEPECQVGLLRSAIAKAEGRA